jgi:tetratricopeptide (TPR) repeat protein
MRKALATASLSSLLFLAAFSLDLATLSPAVHPDDSPETVTAALTLSIQHPPGYPLHSMLGRLAVLSLPGGAAFRVNLLSALMGSLGLLLFAWVARDLASELAGRELGLAYAFSPAAILAVSASLWFQSSIAKGGIYTLNFALSQASLLCLIRARQDGPWARTCLRLAGLFFGLGMANHWTSQVVLLPGMGILVAEAAWKGRMPWIRDIAWPDLAWPALFAACGMSLYLYLPLRSLQGPVMSWGEPWTLKGFLWVFNRAQYAGLESGKTMDAFLALLGRVGSDLALEFHGLGLLAILGGWVLFLWRKPWLGAALLAMPLTLALAVCIKANPPADSLWVIDPYLLPLYAGLALGLCGWLAWNRKAATLVLALGVPALGLWHWSADNQSQNFLGYDYASNLFLSMPKDSLVFCEGDSNTALPLYYRHVLGKRKDVACVATVLSDYPWYMEGIARRNPGLKVPPHPLGPPANISWMASHNSPRPAMLTNSMTKDWVDPKRILPRGLANRLLEKGPPDAAQLRQNRIWPAYAMRGAFAPAQDMDPLTLRLVRDNYKETPARLAYAFQEAHDMADAEKEFAFLGRLMAHWAAPWIQAGNCAYFSHDLRAAGEDWKRAVAEEPGSAEALANLGLFYFDSRDYDQSLSCAHKALDIHPGLPNAQELLDKSLAMLNRPAPAQRQAPGAAAQWASQGDQHAQKGDAVEALKAYDEALRLGFSNAGIYRNRAVMDAKLQHFPEAVAEMRKAVQLEPKNAELQKYLGILLYNSGDPPAAMKALEASQRLDPSDTQVSALIAQVRAKLGH